MSKSPVLLAILDGFGEGAHTADNAVEKAKTPTIDKLKAEFPHGLIDASGLAVGLPPGQMGNSEVGHMNIGSGRVIMQELPRIDGAIEDGSLAKNSELQKFIAALKKSGGACHLLGLLSPGGVHSHQRHIAALAKTVADAGVKVFVHAFIDGRDTPPQSALEYIAEFKSAYPQAVFGTIGGRYYGMDRDKRWDRVQLAYDNLVLAEGKNVSTPEQAIEESYKANKNDEFILPVTIANYQGMKDGDGVLMANFRADRARQILTTLLDPAFKEFERKKIVTFAAALGTVEYSTELNKLMPAIFRSEKLTNILAEVLEANNLTQLHIAETEKYAHVTFFFNGGREEPFKGETRILVSSPKVATYDLQPEMSALEVTEKLIEAINKDTFDFIVVNYANCDMVGHTGLMDAAIKAVETIDSCIARVWKAIEDKGGAMIISADHGNIEKMHDEETQQPHTAHTVNLVPVIIASEALKGKTLNIKEGKLADLAPTVLKLMKIAQPKEMTGQALL